MKPFMIIKFTMKDDGEVGVTTSFPKNIPVSETFRMVGLAINGMILTAQKIGFAKGMGEQEIEDLIFDKK